MSSLFEQYRPTSWDDVVGQQKAVAVLRRVKPGGRAFWFSGPSGSGKTTMARILAAEFCESWHVEEIDAQDCNLDMLRSIEANMSYRGLGAKHGKAWIAREAGLDGQPIERYERLALECKHNLRQMLSRIEAGELIA